MHTFKILSIILSLTMLVLTLVLPVSAKASDFDNEIFVATNGDDSNDGTLSHPLKSITAAKKLAKTKRGTVIVYFREGSYTIDTTVNFNSADRANVTYKAYNGEKVVFTAGKAYTGFEECTVNGVRAFKKNVGKSETISSLFNNETTLKKTRYPENGYLYPKKIDEKDCLNPEVADVDNGIFRAYNAMTANASDLPDLKNPDSVYVRVLHWWKDELLPVKSYDASTGFMEFTKGSSMAIRTEDRYFLENVFEALNEPQEWYFDKSEGVLYYIPNENEVAEDTTLWGGKLETLINVNGVDGISFENIIFRGNGFVVSPERDCSQAAYDAKSCISYVNANNMTIKNCEFRDLASCAVYFGTAVKNATVDSCLFKNIGAQAVYIRGENVAVDNTNVTKDITVKNNIVDGYGKVYYNSVGILVIHANSINVLNNEIHDGYYTAISVGWVWGYAYSVTYNNHICDNLIYDIGQGWLSDMGGIYTLGIQEGTVLSGNVIHNVAADPDEGGYGGWGIYLDEGSSKILVEKNLVYSCGSDSYHLHYGSYNTVRNNIFALSGESQIRINSNYSRVDTMFGSKKTATFTNNIILTDSGISAYSCCDEKDAFEDDSNLFWDLTYGKKLYFNTSTVDHKAWNLKKAIRKGYINNAVIADPLFKDVANFDFELSDNSPASEIGFEEWDYSNAGTISGTTVGLNTNGGTTAYNASSESVPYSPAKAPFRFFRNLIYFIKNLFSKN